MHKILLNTVAKICCCFLSSAALFWPNAVLAQKATMQEQLPAHKKNAQTINLKSGSKFTVQVMRGYQLNVAAEGLKRLRFLAKSPDGRLFATDMFDKSDNYKGRILIFDRWNEQKKTFDTVITYLQGLHNPNQITFYAGHIYIAETDKLSRIPYRAGDNAPTSPATTIAIFPSYGLSYKYGGWHLTRSLLFFNNKLYVSVGSSCNACIEKEEIRATIIEMDADGSNKKIYARGLRNAVGMCVANNQIWVTNMGRDLIGPDKPEDLLHAVTRDGYYGWPFYLQYRGQILADKQFADSVRAAFVKQPPKAPLGFKAHSAPLGLVYLQHFADTALNNGFVVCLHGSTSAWRQRGNSIAFTRADNRYTEIVTGFLAGKTDEQRHGRPCGILQNSSTSIFFTDDHNGVLYYLYRQ